MTRTVLVLLSAGVLALAGCGARTHTDVLPAQANTGPYAVLLEAATNLGDSRAETVQLTAELSDTQSPDRLRRWAAAHGLSVRWQPGAGWAVLQGPPASVAAALGVSVHDYRNPSGEQFYASPDLPILCPSCGHVVPDMAFCPACGVAAQAASLSSREARRRDRPIPGTELVGR
ncbi:hypothetical protein [Mycolicibacterium sphagni]|uniref:Zinc ribbon domain-containing protein n=1 Tax=Mycolicibacterium sphagni TaxID=1786 RepID=A0A255D817_9MYCO|nr:hypothetical protein [Mycolicibacterium sphagni]OYN75220.1 hypothetical protein CG716_26335 [Mycolicibacterium sphagni]